MTAPSNSALADLLEHQLQVIEVQAGLLKIGCGGLQHRIDICADRLTERVAVMGLAKFHGVDIFVVPDGHELTDPSSKTKHYVRKGNAVYSGRSIYMVAEDCEALKAAIPAPPPQEDAE